MSDDAFLNEQTHKYQRCCLNICDMGILCGWCETHIMRLATYYVLVNIFYRNTWNRNLRRPRQWWVSHRGVEWRCNREDISPSTDFSTKLKKYISFHTIILVYHYRIDLQIINSWVKTTRVFKTGLAGCVTTGIQKTKSIYETKILLAYLNPMIMIPEIITPSCFEIPTIS